jgi:hypothetical protein
VKSVNAAAMMVIFFICFVFEELICCLNINMGKKFNSIR